MVDDFLQTVKMDGKMSIIVFNCRSIKKNFNEIKQYLQQLEWKFTVVALTETSLNEVKGTDFDMKGYKFIYMNRNHK